jgi:hypothetical protein
LFGDVGPARIDIHNNIAEWRFDCHLKESAGE